MKEIKFNSQDRRTPSPRPPDRLSSTTYSSWQGSQDAPTSPKLPAVPQVRPRRHSTCNSTCSTSNTGINLGNGLSFQFTGTPRRRHSDACTCESQLPMNDGGLLEPTDQTILPEKMYVVKRKVEARNFQTEPASPLGLDAAPLSPASPLSPRSPLLLKGSPSRPRRHSAGAEMIRQTLDWAADTIEEPLVHSDGNTLPTTTQKMSPKSESRNTVFLIRQAKLADEIEDLPVDEKDEVRMRQELLAQEMLSQRNVEKLFSDNLSGMISCIL